MANKVNINPFYVDTRAIVTDQPVLISSIIVISSVANAGNWEVVLEDNDGNMIFRGVPNFTTQRFGEWSPACSSAVNGINVRTLTNVDQVLIHTQ